METDANTSGKGRRRFRWLIVGLLLIAAGAAGAWWIYSRNAPRAKAAQVAAELSEALRGHDSAAVSRLVVAPPLLNNRSAREIERELVALLSDEISPEGVETLTSEGTFGSLQEVFPVEAAAWAASLGVNAGDCVAFRMERDGLRAELVLLKRGESFLILRCNNVKQMAP